jgi:hypothetical protein
MAKVLADEARMLEPTVGVSTFTKTFPERGPRIKRQLQGHDARFLAHLPTDTSGVMATCAGK